MATNGGDRYAASVDDGIARDAPGPSAPVAVTPAPRRWSRRFLTGLVSLAALAFVVWIVPFRDQCSEAGCTEGLWTTMKRTNVPLLLALFAVHLAGTLVWSARWRALLGLADVRLPLLGTWRITLEAQAGGILLPGIGGDALRVAYVRSRIADTGLAKILASVFADRVIGLVTLAGTAAALGLVFGAGTLGSSLPILVAIPTLAVALWLLLRRPSIARSDVLTAPGLRAKIIKPILEYAAAEAGPRAMGRGLLLSLVVSAVQLVVVRGLVAALGATPDHEAWIYVGTTFAMMVGALPLAPGAWGTADAAFVVFFAEAGIAAPVAAAVCLLYRFFWYATGLIGACSALLRRQQ